MPAKYIFLSPPHMGGDELGWVYEVFESNYIAPVGPMVDAFEREFSNYTGIRHCVALSSGTAAMHLALHHLGIGPGDEVIASTLTFIGSVSPIAFLGATPVFMDCARDTWTLDPDLLEQELASCNDRGRLPKAVVPTDLYGQCCDYGRIFAMCARYGVPVVMDSAEAMGSRYHVRNGSNPQPEEKIQAVSSDWVHAGKGSKAAVFSFNGNKIMTTSGGGMLASDDGEMIEHARKLSQQARDPAPHYEHTELGYNYRLSNVLAAIGRGQLSALENRMRRKRELFDYYRLALGDLPGIDFMPEAAYGKSNRWLTVILIRPDEFGADREAVRLALAQDNIEARPVWKPMHLQPVFNCNVQIPNLRDQDLGQMRRVQARAVGGKVAAELFERGLCLPSGTAMTEEDLERIISVIRGVTKG